MQFRADNGSIKYRIHLRNKGWLQYGLKQSIFNFKVQKMPKNSMFSGISLYGADGNRTRVRSLLHQGISHHSQCFNIPLSIRPLTGLWT